MADCCRWKAVTLYDPKRKEMVMHGGDPLGAAGIGKVYLDDLWLLQAAAPFSGPVWQSVNVSDDDTLGQPPPMTHVTIRIGLGSPNHPVSCVLHV